MSVRNEHAQKELAGLRFDGAGFNRRDLLKLTLAGAAGLPMTTSAAVAQDSDVTRGGTIRGAVVGPITSLDPYYSKVSSGDSISYELLYNSLMQVTNTGEMLPELAAEWSVSEDGLTYTFQLVEGVTFHDGTPLDAEAIQFNLERYIEEGSLYSTADRIRVLSSIDAPDPTTLVITLSSPNTPFLANVAGIPIVSPTAVEEMGEDFQLSGVGSGPFKFESWSPGSTATFVRFENYWEVAPDGEPYPLLDGVVIDGVPDDSVRLLNLRSGEFEINERVNPRDVETLRTNTDIEVVATSHVTPYILALNPNQPPFDNQTLRQAVQASLDRQAIIDNVSFGTGYTAPMPFPREAWFFIEEPSPVYDPERAQQLLVEAGYPDGIDVSFSIINRPTDNQIAQIVKPLLDAVGIRTEIEVLERTTWVDLWTARNGQMGLLQGGSTPTDPDGQSGWWSPTNITNWAGIDHPEIWDLIERSNETTDQEERLALWKQVNELNIEAAVYTFIGAVPSLAAHRTSVRDMEYVAGYQWQLVQVSLDE